MRSFIPGEINRTWSWESPEAARKGVHTFQAIHQFRQQSDVKVRTLGRRGANAARIVESLYSKPVTTSRFLSAHLNLSQATVDRLLTDLRHIGIVSEMTGGRRNRVFYFQEYYNLFLE